MTKANVFMLFAQRALWLYTIEASIVLAIAIAIGAHT
jgi:hypothetical protein